MSSPTDKPAIVEAATQAGLDSFMATFGRVPDNFQLMADEAPGAFAGYGLMRDFAMRSPAKGGALDMKTKELVFALLDALIGQTEAAKRHAEAGMRHGLTVPELTEGLVQVMMVGGITTWNRSGADILRHCRAKADAVPG